MASVAKAITGATAWQGGKREIVEVTYDGAVDGLAQGALTLFTAAADLIIERVIAKVKTAVTSGGSATVEVGKSGDTAGLVAQTGKASLGAGVVVDSKKGGYKLASGESIIQTIGTADLLTGKIVYDIEYSLF